MFGAGEVDRIYLNFSDPWPKDRHAKRRLTSRQFMARYDIILKPDGQVEFKTDNKDLFDFSLEEIKEADWELPVVTFDLHNDSVLNEGNVMTEYEAFARKVSEVMYVHKGANYRVVRFKNSLADVVRILNTKK